MDSVLIFLLDRIYRILRIYFCSGFNFRRELTRLNPRDGGAVFLGIHSLLLFAQNSVIKTAHSKMSFSPKAIAYILFLLETKYIRKIQTILFILSNYSFIKTESNPL